MPVRAGPAPLCRTCRPSLCLSVTSLCLCLSVPLPPLSPAPLYGPYKVNYYFFQVFLKKILDARKAMVISTINLYCPLSVVALYTTFLGIVFPVAGAWASPSRLTGRFSSSFSKSLLCAIEPPANVSPLSSNTVKQLQDMCRAAKLPVGGRKSDLIARLEQSKPDEPTMTHVSATKISAPTTAILSDSAMPRSHDVVILACKS